MSELAVIEAGANVPARGSVDLLAVAKQAEAARQLGATLIASGLLPDAIKKPEQAVLVILKGQELDLPPVYSLSHLVVVKGKPTMSAELMRALVQRAGHKIRIVENTRERAVVEGVRRDDPDHPVRVSFDSEDVRIAGLQGQMGHKNYPAALKLARATSALCRAYFADVLGGISYTPEELGAEVDEEGEVVEASEVTPPLATREQLNYPEALIVDVVDDGVPKFEETVGKPLSELSREEANEWIGRLSGRPVEGQPDVEEHRELPVGPTESEPDAEEAEMVEEGPDDSADEPIPDTLYVELVKLLDELYEDKSDVMDGHEWFEQEWGKWISDLSKREAEKLLGTVNSRLAKKRQREGAEA